MSSLHIAAWILRNRCACLGDLKWRTPLSRPQVGYGAAVARDSTFVQLTYIYRKDRWVLITNALIGKTGFDENNPIYGRRQDSDQLLLGTAVSYQRPVYL